ncbi:MAG: serine hydrolase [Nanoarchaeota archaeon]
MTGLVSTARNNVGCSRRYFLGLSLALGAELGFGASAFARNDNTEKPEIRPSNPNHKSNNLEQTLQNHILGLSTSGKIGLDERVAVSVYDLKSQKTLAAINEEIPMQTGSMSKPDIILVYFYKVERGDLSYDDSIRRHMEIMIAESKNVPTNWIMYLAGGPNEVQRILKEKFGYIFHQTEINDYIPLDPKERKEAKAKGLDVPDGKSFYSNLASAGDYKRFLQMIWQSKLPYSSELLKMMQFPKKRKNKRILGAENIPNGTKVYNKTGTHAFLNGDMGIVEALGQDGNTYPYVIAVIVEKEINIPNSELTQKRGELQRSHVIAGISRIVYGHMKMLYGLK